MQIEEDQGSQEWRQIGAHVYCSVSVVWLGCEAGGQGRYKLNS